MLELSPEFEVLLEPLGPNAAAFFLAAALYHAQHISFASAAQLAQMPQEQFMQGLEQHFGTGLYISEESLQQDIDTVRQL